MKGKEKCSQCMNWFSMLKLPRKLPCCEHSICEPCIRQIIDAKLDMIMCGFCSACVRKQEIRVFPLNTPLLLSLSEKPKVQQAVLNEEDNELLGDLMLTGSQVCQEPNPEDHCPTHKVVMDIVCISDKQRICPHCALFGPHRDHRIKRLEEFDNELKEHKRKFYQIQKQKQKTFKTQIGRIDDQLRNQISSKKGALRGKIQDQFRKFDLQLKKRKETTLNEIEQVFNKLEHDFRDHGPLQKFQHAKDKLQSWQKSCQSTLYKLQATKRIEDKLSFYYQGPLEIVTEGYIYIQELNKCREESLKKMGQVIGDVNVVFDQGKKWFEKCVKVIKGQPSGISELKESDDCDINPFLDCTSSEIVLGTNSFLNAHNTSIEVDIASIPTSSKVHQQKQTEWRTPKSRQTDIKPVKSIEKQRPRLQTQTSSAYMKKVVQSPKAPATTQALKRPISELTGFRSPGKINGKQSNTHNRERSFVQPEGEAKQPEKLYLQFSKSTRSDFFDISDCHLPSDKLVQYVHRARRIHKIRGLKICNNQLTTQGFDKMIEHLQGVSNINAANNELNEGIFEVIFKNKEKLDSLRILNLTHNPVHLERKSEKYLEEVKKMGVIVTF